MRQSCDTTCDKLTTWLATSVLDVRKKLALDQPKVIEIFGGGVNAFSRYEKGKTKPPLAMVKLLKVLDRHPDLISEIK